MAIRFNHTLVHATDKHRSAKFLAEILGLPAPTSFGHFQVVKLADDASLDFVDAGGEPIYRQHYAFLIDEREFDEIYGRIQARGLSHWADPFRQKAGEINHHFGGRGVYFADPDDHLMEVITRPYGNS